LTVLFWDIDGTLLRTAKAGVYAFYQATQEIYGQCPDFGLLQMAGMTDCHIASQIIGRLTGQEATENEIYSLIAHYEKLLPEHLAARNGFVIPPTAEILAALKDNPDYISVLLTGNTYNGAKAKLGHYKIDSYFDFTASAFGDNCFNRTDVATTALANVKKSYPRESAQNVYVIGDTPNDICCGKSIGARTIAVATGTYSAMQLAEHDPWWVVDKLPSPATFAAKIK
jgi:phosphoglycolate phosphatase-like HAD superfamily hydrolase